MSVETDRLNALVKNLEQQIRDNAGNATKLAALNADLAKAKVDCAAADKVG